MSGWLDVLKQSLVRNLPVLKAVAGRIANLKALEHALNCARDEAEYADLRNECAKRIGCTPGRLTEVFNAIADSAHDLCG